MGIWISGGLKNESEPTPEPYVPPTWADGTDAEIAEALEKHYNDEGAAGFNLNYAFYLAPAFAM